MSRKVLSSRGGQSADVAISRYNARYHFSHSHTASREIAQTNSLAMTFLIGTFTEQAVRSIIIIPKIFRNNMTICLISSFSLQYYTQPFFNTLCMLSACPFFRSTGPLHLIQVLVAGALGLGTLRCRLRLAVGEQPATGRLYLIFQVLCHTKKVQHP